MSKLTADKVLADKFGIEPWDTEALAAAAAFAPDPLAEAIRQGEEIVRKDEADAKAREYPAPMTSAELANTEFPPDRFLLDRLIMEGIPQTIDGDGGIGKSSVAVGFTVAIGAGVPIFGKDTIRSPGLFITHEDKHKAVQTMARAYAKALNVNLADLPVQWWSLTGHDITLAVIDDKGAWTPEPFLTALDNRLRASPRGMFVTLDCRSDVVQMNEVLREPPNTFYKTILTPLCEKYNCTILVLCHPSKASMADGSYYSGGTGNKSALRNKLVMKLKDDAPGADPLGPRVLDVLKRNLGPRDNTGVRLTFDPERGVFVADNEREARVASAKLYGAVVEQIKALIAEGIAVQIGNTGSGQGPRDVAAAMNAAGIKITEKDVKAKMKQAIRDKLLGYREAKAGGRARAGFTLTPDDGGDFGPG